MKNKIYYLETETKKYPLVFNLNVMEEIQEAYGTLSKWGNAVENEDGEPNVKNLKAGLSAMINEGVDMENEQNGSDNPPLNSKQIGRILSETGLKKIQEMIKDITVESTKSETESKNM